GALEAHLGPAAAAVLAVAAPVIVVIHHALADPGLGRRHTCADRYHHTARLVPGDDTLGTLDASRHRPARLRGGPVVVQIAAAHAGGLDLQHDVAGSGRRIGKVAQLEPAVAEKNHALHVAPPKVLRRNRRAAPAGWQLSADRRPRKGRLR